MNFTCLAEPLAGHAISLKNLAAKLHLSFIIYIYAILFSFQLIYLRKLHYYDFHGKTYKCITNFIANRKQTAVLEGERSDKVNIISGIPQGSVLGPCLFLFYINDIPNHITSRVRLFTDDTIRSSTDRKTLQSDLQQLGEWERRWQMEFHRGKCQVLSITHTKNIIDYGNMLEQHVNTAKYLGITLSHDLCSNQPITNKANRTLGFLRHNLQINNPQIKAKPYNTLVRPSVEHTTSVWDPYTQVNIQKIEMVQRRVACFTRYKNKSSVSSMIEELGGTLLEERQKHQRLTILHKIKNRLVAVAVEMVQRRVACFTRYKNKSSVSSMIEELGRTSLEERQKHQRLTILHKIKNRLVAVDGSQYLTPCTLTNQTQSYSGFHCSTQMQTIIVSLSFQEQ